MLKDLKLNNITYQKDIIKAHNVIINGKNFYDQPTDSDIE